MPRQSTNATWLLKTEPSVYAYADLAKAKSAVWDGVANPTACQHLRRFVPGDSAWIYHTGDEKAIVGLAQVVSAPVADPKQPGVTAKGEVKFPVVELRAVGAVKTRLTLAEMKADARFAGWELLTQARLSVMPVPAALAAIIRSTTGV